MNTQTVDKYDLSHDPDMVKYWVMQGPRTAAFLLVIPGCAVMGYGVGMLVASPAACGLVGFGAGLLIWGLVVALTK